VAWTHTEMMQIFNDRVEPTVTAGALDGDQLHVTTMTIDNDEDGYN